ncbi:MAG: hypothetical protein NXH75_00370 [Halobacteriovoraceae bacterium]|nr:hypothetical protein [Halobacteriovoraceae bacterium]
MKTALIFALISISSFAVSTPYELNGEFSFTGETKSIFSKRYEPVYAFTRSGRERLADLKSQGWSCAIKPRQTYLCSKADVAKQIPAHIEDRVDALYGSMKVEFENKTVIPVLTNDAPALKEYRINKELIFNGKVYPYFDYRILKSQNGDLHRVLWGEGIHREEFIVLSEKLLWNVETFSDQEKKYYDTFVITGDFR